jgi:hypothetical protein
VLYLSKTTKTRLQARFVFMGISAQGTSWQIIRNNFSLPIADLL